MPEGWERWRARWEYGHAVSTVLQIAGFFALVWSVLRETPRRTAAPARRG